MEVFYICPRDLELSHYLQTQLKELGLPALCTISNNIKLQMPPLQALFLRSIDTTSFETKMNLFFC